jgi:hypothetical protein
MAIIRSLTTVGIILNLAGLLLIYQSLLTSQQAVKIAHDAGVVAMDTEKRQLRAYVIASTSELTNFAENGIGHVIGDLENMGQTPVTDAHWLSGINVLPLEGDFSYPDCDAVNQQDEGSSWFFGKSAHPVKDRATPFTVDEINDVKSDNKLIVFHGRVCYKDVFKEQRYTDFCFQWRWDAKINSLQQGIYRKNGNGST